MRIVIDVCVSPRAELELWRAGYKVPVRAADGEPDRAWLDRAARAGCQVAVTADFGAGRGANERGMYSVIVPHGMGGDDMIQHILDGMEEVERRHEPRPVSLLAPLAAVGIALALAACAPRPQAREPDHAPVPWCFAAVVRFDGRDHGASGCFETEPLCGNAQRRAVRWGGVAGIKEVGSCQQR